MKPAISHPPIRLPRPHGINNERPPLNLMFRPLDIVRRHRAILLRPLIRKLQKRDDGIPGRDERFKRRQQQRGEERDGHDGGADDDDE